MNWQSPENDTSQLNSLKSEGLRPPATSSRHRSKSLETRQEPQAVYERQGASKRERQSTEDASDVVGDSILLGTPGGRPTFVAVRDAQSGWVSVVELMEEIVVDCVKKIDNDATADRKAELREISNDLDDAAFQLRTWAVESDIEDAEDFDHTKREVVDFVNDVLDRLEEKLRFLRHSIEGTSRPQATNTKLIKVENVDEDDAEETEEENAATQIKSVKTQIRAICRTSKPFRESVILRDDYEACERQDTIERVRTLIAEGGKYLGTPEALKKYGVDDRFKGRKALEEAKANALELDENEQKDSPKSKVENIAGVTYLSPSQGNEPPRRSSADLPRRDRPPFKDRPPLYLENHDSNPTLEYFIPRRRRTFERKKQPVYR